MLLYRIYFAPKLILRRAAIRENCNLPLDIPRCGSTNLMASMTGTDRWRVLDKAACGTSFCARNTMSICLQPLQACRL